MGPATCFFVEAINTKVDDCILEVLRILLPKQEVDQCLKMTGRAQMQYIANLIIRFTDSQRNIFYWELSHRSFDAIIKEEERNFSDNELNTAMQIQYFLNKNGLYIFNHFNNN